MSIASTEEETFEWKDANGVSHMVPKVIEDALTAPFRGQSGFGPQHLYVLDQFQDTAEYVVTLDPKKSYAKNVRTLLVCKFDQQLKTNVAFRKINSGKLLNKLIDCKGVPDDVKLKLIEKCCATHAKEWRASYEKKRKALEAPDEAGLLAAEEHVENENDPTAAKRRERQAVLSEIGVKAYTKIQIAAFNFVLGCFFFACRTVFPLQS